jgi:hypothetical protein
MAKWTYSTDGSRQRAVPSTLNLDDEEPDSYEIDEACEACAEHDWNDHDGWERGHTEREIQLFKDGLLFCTCTVNIDIQPVFTAVRDTQSAKQGEQ